MRYLISIICIALLLGGCDIASGVQAKPKVVRKKIVASKDTSTQVRKKKTMRTAKSSATDNRQKRTLSAKFNGNPTAGQKQPAAGNNSAPQPAAAQKQQAAPIEIAALNPADKQKPAISPKSDITEIKQAVEKEKQSDNVQPAPDSKPDSTGDSTAVAPHKTAANKFSITLALQSDGTPAQYDPEGKLDPFEPLFKEEKVVAGSQLKRVKRVPRTPLEHIEIGQLKLVGIILAASGNRALVEEASGKGYVIKEGTYIGTNGGKIVSIQKEIVTVEEELEDIYGKIVVRTRELKLPKPPGEF